MLRSEFDGHPLWATTAAIKDQVNAIREQHVDADFSHLEATMFYVNHAESFRDLAGTHMVFFSSPMLEQVRMVFADASAMLANRLSTLAPDYTANAAAYAEGSLIPMAPWPRPYGKGGQIPQLETLFEDLLERQRTSVAEIQRVREKVDETISTTLADFKLAAEASRSELAEMNATAASAFELVTLEKARLDEIAQQGLKNVTDVVSTNETRFLEWTRLREAKYEAELAPFKEKIEANQLEANLTLGELRSTNEQYLNLAALAAGDIIGTHFGDESRWGRKSGLWLYGIGFFILAAAAVPLVFLLFDEHVSKSDGSPDWGRIAVRLSLAVLAGSGATVLIRLGARLISDANASKRMELELRSFGPFLANVSEPTHVDAARLQLLDRAFGKSYGTVDLSGEKDVVQVSAIAQVLELFAKFTK